MYTRQHPGVLEDLKFGEKHNIYNDNFEKKKFLSLSNEIFLLI